MCINNYVFLTMCSFKTIPLRQLTASVVASVLPKYFTFTGFSAEIERKAGTELRKLIQQVLSVLDIRQIRSAAFHPETRAQGNGSIRTREKPRDSDKKDKQ